MPARQTLLSCVGLLMTAVAALAYIFLGGLRINPLESKMSVIVMLPESGGLLADQDVTMRGIPIGRVQSVQLTDHGVQAIATVDAAIHIPSDSPVRVSGLSAAGEQYLDFRPDHDQGPYLRDGAVVSGEQATAPASLAQIIDHSRGALAQLDATKLNAMFQELRVGHEGPEKLAAIFDGASLLASTLDSVLPQTVSMIRNTQVVFDTLSDVGPGQNLGPALRRLGHGNIEAGTIQAEHGVVEEAAGAGGLIDGAEGQLAVFGKVEEPGFDLSGCQGVRADAVIAGEFGDGFEVGLTGTVGQTTDKHGVVHAQTQGGRHDESPDDGRDFPSSSEDR